MKSKSYICLSSRDFFILLSYFLLTEQLDDTKMNELEFLKSIKTKGSDLNILFTNKVNLMMSVGVKAYKMFLNILLTGIENDSYDFLNVESSEEILNSSMREMLSLKEILTAYTPYQAETFFENQKKINQFQSDLIKKDKTIIFEPTRYKKTVEELNEMFLLSKETQTFVEVSLEIEEEIEKLRLGSIRSKMIALPTPIFYIPYLIIAFHFNYFMEMHLTPNTPIELSNYMLSKMHSALQ
jgi:hypothetical protein